MKDSTDSPILYSHIQVAYLGSVEDKETLAACVGKMIMEAPLL